MYFVGAVLQVVFRKHRKEKNRKCGFEKIMTRAVITFNYLLKGW